jgi:hypothetical protein
MLRFRRLDCLVDHCWSEKFLLFSFKYFVSLKLLLFFGFVILNNFINEEEKEGSSRCAWGLLNKTISEKLCHS